MSFQQQNIDFAIGRHKELVRTGERRALRLAEAEPRTRAGGTHDLQAAGRLAGRLASWAHDLVHLRTTPAQGEQPAG